MKKNTSIKRKFIVFSAALFLLIVLGGSGAFLVSMRQIVQSSKGNELLQMAEIERSRLASSVNGEIAIALKMAGSP